MQVSAATALPTKDLMTRIRLSLKELSYHQLDSVTFTIQEPSHVTLSGRLRSYYLKQIAQTIVMKVPGVDHVTNEIKVVE